MFRNTLMILCTPNLPKCADTTHCTSAQTSATGRVYSHIPNHCHTVLIYHMHYLDFRVCSCKMSPAMRLVFTMQKSKQLFCAGLFAAISKVFYDYDNLHKGSRMLSYQFAPVHNLLQIASMVCDDTWCCKIVLLSYSGC